jgi:drug/metabolite transporter (DMT)-like permease
LGTSRT